MLYEFVTKGPQSFWVVCCWLCVCGCVLLVARLWLCAWGCVFVVVVVLVVGVVVVVLRCVRVVCWALWSWWLLRPGSAHCNLALAGEVR